MYKVECVSYRSHYFKCRQVRHSIRRIYSNYHLFYIYTSLLSRSFTLYAPLNICSYSIFCGAPCVATGAEFRSMRERPMTGYYVRFVFLKRNGESKESFLKKIDKRKRLSTKNQQQIPRKPVKS